MTAAFHTSLEVAVEVFSERIQTGERKLTSLAYLTFVTIDANGDRLPVPPLLLETDADRERAAEAEVRRAARLQAKARLHRRLIKSAGAGRAGRRGRRPFPAPDGPARAWG